MNKSSYRKVALIVGLSVIVSLVTIGGLWMVYAQFEGPEVLAQGNFDGWGYVAYREDGGVVAEVMYDRDTPEGIKAYAAANSIWAQDLLRNSDTVRVVVVLRKPVSFEQFQTKVKDIGIIHNRCRQLCDPCLRPGRREVDYLWRAQRGRVGSTMVYRSDH